MNTEDLTVLLEQLRHITDPQRVCDLTDGELLERFLDRRDDAAFGLLVHRHGALVLSVCRRLLASLQDAEDAFQATYLILARKARSIRKRQSLASWLHGVARRVSMKSRARARGRRECELLQAPIDTHDPCVQAAAVEFRRVIDEEFHSLPERYRAPAILCLLE